MYIKYKIQYIEDVMSYLGFRPGVWVSVISGILSEQLPVALHASQHSYKVDPKRHRKSYKYHKIVLPYKHKSTKHNANILA